MHLKERMFLYNMRNMLEIGSNIIIIIILYEYGLAATIMIVKSCWTADIYHEFRATSIPLDKYWKSICRFIILMYYIYKDIL